MEECIFCKIANKQINVPLLYEDSKVVAFSDREPKAKVHILIVPKKHIASVNDVTGGDVPNLGKLFVAAKIIAYKMKLNETGYRLVVNTGGDAGQTVCHIHMHLLGGQGLGPMG